jgi:hypothetical protein
MTTPTDPGQSDPAAQMKAATADLEHLQDLLRRAAQGQARAAAQSALRGLTCGDGEQKPESGPPSHGPALHLHGEHATPVQVRAISRSACRRDSLDSASDGTL